MSLDKEFNSGQLLPKKLGLIMTSSEVIAHQRLRNEWVHLCNWELRMTKVFFYFALVLPNLIEQLSTLIFYSIIMYFLWFSDVMVITTAKLH